VYAIAGGVRPWFSALVPLAAFTGLPWGEVIALRRRHLDLDGAGVVNVRGSVAEVDGVYGLDNDGDGTGCEWLRPGSCHHRARNMTATARGVVRDTPHHHFGVGPKASAMRDRRDQRGL
jgi:integrase